MARNFCRIKLLKPNKQYTRLYHIALLLMLMAVSTTCVIVPFSKAQSENSPISTHAYATVSPNPVGVNQETTIIMWLAELSPTSTPDGGWWEGYTLTITKPDNSTQELGPFTADPASYARTTYTPEQIGTYTIEFNFPGQHLTGIGAVIPTPIDLYYKASSFVISLSVQQQPVAAYPQPSLPTEYWTRPINAQNKNWYTISGNWFGLDPLFYMGNSGYNITGNFNPYTTAPNSAHVVWTKALQFGGLIGGEFGGTSTANYYTGKMYEATFGPPIIINGVLYYNSLTPPRMGFYAVDLRTGQTLWWQNSTGYPYMTRVLAGTWSYPGITVGQVYNYQSPNQIGGIPYLWFIPPPGVVARAPGIENEDGVKMDWIMYDAVTGNPILHIANSTDGGTIVQGPNGELLVYILDNANNWLAMWNSSLCIGTLGDISPFPTDSWCWRPETGATLDWNKGVQWNVTTNSYPGQAIVQINSGVILATTGSYIVKNDWQMEIGYDVTTGAELWVQNRTLPQSTSWEVIGTMANGIFTEFDAGSMQWTGYNAYTGEKIWGPSEAYTNAWGSQPMDAAYAYDKLFGMSVDGIHAFDIATGQHLWDFNAGPSGLDFPGYDTYPFMNYAMTIADGKVFAATGASYGNPLYSGALLYAINATSGKQVWNINGFFTFTMPVADGYLVAFNGYDNQIYCFGKGTTATTLTASSKVSTLGESILIEGTVIDTAAGTGQNEQAGRFPNGVPAVSDESMSDWMEYVYMQQQYPDNVTGIPITIDVIDSNGNYRNIGTTTSDASGFFSYMWTPDISGKYTVIATFAGSESYYGSYAEAAFGVQDAPQATPEPTPQPASAADLYFLPVSIGMTVAIIVVGAVLILMLRRR